MPTLNYYNDIDPKACAWLRELIAQCHLPPGDVDERSILEIKPDELAKYDQCHFFAGIGFWSLALQWAGLGHTPGIWTGSCPCQPFSCAGAGKGTADERHLWPVFRDLIVAFRPRVVFGEQVASAAVVGKVGRGVAKPTVPVWLDGVRADMEAAGYAFGAAVLGAHSVGAPHIRQRVYWVADAAGERCGEARGSCDRSTQRAGEFGDALRPSDAEHAIGGGEQSAGWPGCWRSGLGGNSESGGASDVQRTGLEGHAGHGTDGHEPGRDRAEPSGHAAESGVAGRTRDTAGNNEQRNWESRPSLRREIAAGGSMPWSDHIVHRYLDGKDRRIPAEPRLFPLADDRHPYHRGRVGLLRGAGNAIVPALAAEFVIAWMECQCQP